jgi:hypothetical protein
VNNVNANFNVNVNFSFKERESSPFGGVRRGVTPKPFSNGNHCFII